jgi:F-type H+-transporting ATPase subunit b
MRIRSLIAAALIAGAAPFAVVALAAPVAAQTTTTPTITHVSEECIAILEKGGVPDDCQKAPSPILPAWNEVIWGGLSFLVLFGLMWKFAFPPLRNAMEARAQRIRESLDEAERTKSDAQRILEDYQRQLADAKNESSRIIEEARQTAEQMRRDLMTRAEAEVQEVRQRATEDIQLAKERAFAELNDRLTTLAISAAEVVVQKNLDPETNRALVERFIEQVGTAS